jgi:trimeric autotransporter adhesin
MTIAITAGTGTPGATLTCATNPLAATNGVASFSACAISLAGSGYTLTVTAAGVSATTSTSFTES